MYQRDRVLPPLGYLLRKSYVGNGKYSLKSKDPRDKIWGLLGIASDAAELGISPDYSQSPCKPNVAYEAVTRALIRQGNIDILTYCRSREVQKPSWIPN